MTCTVLAAASTGRSNTEVDGVERPRRARRAGGSVVTSRGADGERWVARVTCSRTPSVSALPARRRPRRCRAAAASSRRSVGSGQRVRWRQQQRRLAAGGVLGAAERVGEAQAVGQRDGGGWRGCRYVRDRGRRRAQVRRRRRRPPRPSPSGPVRRRGATLSPRSRTSPRRPARRRRRCRRPARRRSVHVAARARARRVGQLVAAPVSRIGCPSRAAGTDAASASGKELPEARKTRRGRGQLPGHASGGGEAVRSGEPTRRRARDRRGRPRRGGRAPRCRRAARPRCPRRAGRSRCSATPGERRSSSVSSSGASRCAARGAPLRASAKSSARASTAVVGAGLAVAGRPGDGERRGDAVRTGQPHGRWRSGGVDRPRPLEERAVGERRGDAELVLAGREHGGADDAETAAGEPVRRWWSTSTPSSRSTTSEPGRSRRRPLPRASCSPGGDRRAGYRRGIPDAVGSRRRCRARGRCGGDRRRRSREPRGSRAGPQRGHGVRRTAAPAGWTRRTRTSRWTSVRTLLGRRRTRRTSPHARTDGRVTLRRPTAPT